MNWRKAIILAAGASVAGTSVYIPQAPAQTFQTYRCADGTQFIVGFYASDNHAYLQIDGKPVTLARRLALSGSRYTGGGVTLKITKGGITVKHAKRRMTVCELA